MLARVLAQVPARAPVLELALVPAIHMALPLAQVLAGNLPQGV